jgi:transcriptional regulator with PAS, ATPase and Fis domain
MKNDLNDLKRVTKELMDGNVVVPEENKLNENFIIQPKEEVSQNLAEKEKEILTLQEQEKILIEESLIRHQGRRKDAAEELGISERTLYRKIKEYLL